MFAIASGSAHSETSSCTVMAQIAQLVLAAVALLVVLQTCQAQRRYVGKVVCVFTLFYACMCAFRSVCYRSRSSHRSYQAAVTHSYTAYYQCWWSRCSRYIGNFSRDFERIIIYYTTLSQQMHRTRYHRYYETRYYTGYYSVFGCCAGYRSCSCSWCRSPPLGCQSCSSGCCRKYI